MNASRAALAFVLTLVTGCASAPPPRIPPTDAIVTIRSNVADADVIVDGRSLGTVGLLKGGIALPPGAHRVELRRDDYVSRYEELRLARGQRVNLDLSMLPIPP